MNLYRHKKSGRTYEVISESIINATNDQDGQEMVLYTGERRDGSGKGIFVRELSEFYDKFERENENEIKKHNIGSERSRAI